MLKKRNIDNHENYRVYGNLFTENGDEFLKTKTSS